MSSSRDLLTQSLYILKTPFEASKLSAISGHDLNFLTIFNHIINLLEFPTIITVVSKLP